MRSALDRFYSMIPNDARRVQAALIEYFLYFICVERGQDLASVREIEVCFEGCDLEVPKNVSARLNEGVRAKPAKFLKTPEGYRLHRHVRERISAKLGASSATATAEVSLRKLQEMLPDGPSKQFFSETIDCLEVEAYRAAIVMGWILAVDYLISYILKNRLSDFNSVLEKNTDRRIRISKIVDRDDFGEVPEGKLIEFSRSASIISNDVRKILDEKLGTRNSAAHPSIIKFTRTKAVEFVEDLLVNVVLKYPL